MGGCTRRVDVQESKQGANSMAVSGLHGRKVLVITGKAISAIFGINGLRK